MDDLFSDFHGQSNDEMNYDDMLLDEEKEINQEEVWVVIDEYFRVKGLVGQQLDSFDEFIKNYKMTIRRPVRKPVGTVQTAAPNVTEPDTGVDAGLSIHFKTEPMPV
jgi:DNA-directed RNA polymerase beta subunit